MARKNVGAAPSGSTDAATVASAAAQVTAQVPKKMVFQPYTDALPTSPSVDTVVMRIKA
jgi:hypothetical protein